MARDKDRPHQHLGLLTATVLAALGGVCSLTLLELRRMAAEPDARRETQRSAIRTLGPSARRASDAAEVPPEEALRRIDESPDLTTLAQLFEREEGLARVEELVLDHRISPDLRAYLLHRLQSEAPQSALSIAIEIRGSPEPPETLLLLAYDIIGQSGERDLLRAPADHVVESAQVAAHRLRLLAPLREGADR